MRLVLIPAATDSESGQEENDLTPSWQAAHTRRPVLLVDAILEEQRLEDHAQVGLGPSMPDEYSG